MKSWTSALSVAFLATVGCVATKGDIRLIQDELRATRAQVAAGDTLLLRADEARRQQVAALSAAIDRMNDSLRTLTSRFAAFQANAVGEFDAMGRQMVQVQALLGQNTRTVQETRAQLQQLRASNAVQRGERGAQAGQLSHGQNRFGSATHVLPELGAGLPGAAPCW